MTPPTTSSPSLRLVLLLLLLLLLLPHPSLSCYPGAPNSARPAITIGDETYVCIIINDRYFGVATPIADQFSRLIVNGSSIIATSPNGWTDICPSNPFWFPLECATSPQALGGWPATNFYISSGGQVINYKKTYLYLDPTAGEYVFPVTVAVISVSNGIVNNVFWDDGCYFCPGSGVNSDPACSDGQAGCQQCLPNAYSLADNSALALNSSDATSGMDCGVVTTSCTAPAAGSTKVLPLNFCDLAVYIVWTGTDVNGVEFSSSGRRFRRFRDYGMPTQLMSMQQWTPGGNSLSPAPPPTSPVGRMLHEVSDVIVKF